SADGGDSAFTHSELRAFFEFAGDTGEVNIDNVALRAGHNGTEALGSYTAPDQPQAAELVLDFNTDAIAFGGATVRRDNQDDGGTDREMLRIEKPTGDNVEAWAGVTVVDYGDTEDDLVTSLDDAITMRVYSEQDGDVTLKLERYGAPTDGSNLGAIEITQAVTTGWNDLSFALTGLSLGGGEDMVAADVVKASVFVDLNDAGAGQTIFIDDLAFPNVDLVGSDTTTQTYSFNAGADVTPFGSATATFGTQTDEGTNVREMLEIGKPDGAQVWAGVTIADYGDTENDLMSTPGEVTMRVYAEQAGDITLKLERFGAPADNSVGTVELEQSVDAGWNDVTFDFSSSTLTGGESLADQDIVKASVFGDLNDAAAGQTYFIDDVTFANAIIIA
ncbi:MAG: hypothetical protein L7V29_06665, partial [Alphaproteobacteria bacterium]|nr:hypothetical protein [Alphaproteobacteria bacterium]